MSNTNESSAKLSRELSSTSVPKTAVPETGPDWKTAKLEWGVAWEFHWYGLPVAFAFLAINSVAAIVLANKKKAFARTVFFDAINSLQVLFGMSRALCLLIDPYEIYESKMNIGNCPVWITRPLWDRLSLFNLIFLFDSFGFSRSCQGSTRSSKNSKL